MANEALVTRTYRAAIRCGEDFITIEETISLPPAASDDEISQAVDTGLRIYRAQQAAIEAQVAAIRAEHPAAGPRILDPEAPASEKQRSYLEYLANALEWPAGQLQNHLRDQGATLEALTKGQASEIIDALKKQLDGGQPAPASESAPAAEQTVMAAAVAQSPVSGGAPASTRQIAALQRVAGQHGVDIADEARARFGVAHLNDLTSHEAGALLQELQNRAAKR
ncbi:MAG TPA: hypothetical protein VGE07_03515 [Herpetosiphonaceae bacterium]